MRRPWLLVVCLIFGAGCGPSPDYSPNFAGDWAGVENFTYTDARSGRQATSQWQGTWAVIGNGPNSLLLVRFCDLNFHAGPQLTPTSPTEFSVQPYNCTVVTNSCPADVSVTGGSGSLASGTLTITLAGTMQAGGSATCPGLRGNFTVSLAVTRAQQ